MCLAKLSWLLRWNTGVLRHGCVNSNPHCVCLFFFLLLFFKSNIDNNSVNLKWMCPICSEKLSTLFLFILVVCTRYCWVMEPIVPRSHSAKFVFTALYKPGKSTVRKARSSVYAADATAVQWGNEPGETLSVTMVANRHLYSSLFADVSIHKSWPSCLL